MKIKISNIEKTLFEASDVAKVDIPGITGSFQIQKDHAKLADLLKNEGVINIIHLDKSEKLFPFTKGGFITVEDNNISIMLM